MKKIIAFAFLFFSVFVCLTAVSPKEFTIRGYKVERTQDPVMTVVDALTGSLKEITENTKELNIDGYYTLGNAATTTASTVNDIAFSYRVSGSKEGKYTVSIEVAPFRLVDLNGNYSSTVINTRYFLVNETVRFLDSNNSTTSDYVESDGTMTNGFKISDADNSNTTKDSGVISSVTTKTLEDSFQISKGTKESSQYADDVWIARGAVGLMIDSSSFNSATEGEYHAAIKITLSNIT